MSISEVIQCKITERIFFYDGYFRFKFLLLQNFLHLKILRVFKIQLSY